MPPIFQSSLAVVAAAVALFTLSTTGLDRLSPGPALYSCRLPVAQSEPYRVLVVGESWAAGDRLLPELPQAIAARLDGRAVHVCSMAFSGKNTARIYLGVKREELSGGVRRAFHGGRPDAVILLNGVNDQIQHVGSRRYVSDTVHIANLFKGSNFQVVSVPNVHPAGAVLGPLLKLRSAANRVLVDHGHDDVTAEYRAALEAAHPELRVIDYTGFMPGFVAANYTADGIHLTAPEFHKYGLFLGEHVLLQ